MKLFYNNAPLRKSPIAEELFSTPDFSLEIFNKLTKNQKCEIIKLSFNKDNKPYNFYGVKSNNSFFYPNGEIIFSYLKNIFEYDYDIHNMEIENVDPFSIIKNEKLSSISKEILSDFFLIKKEFTIKDKFNEDYSLKIIENSDLTIGDNVYIDEICIFKNDIKIGYLKAKYCPKKFFHLYPDFQDDFFLDKATIDYSRIDNEYQNKGLGYILYFYAAQHFNSKNITFRQSSLCSESAQLLWSKLDEHFNDFVSTKLIDKKSKHLVKFLSIPENNSIFFVNNKPKVKKII